MSVLYFTVPPGLSIQRGFKSAAFIVIFQKAKMALRRQLGFRGKDADYIPFLENQIIELSKVIQVSGLPYPAQTANICCLMSTCQPPLWNDPLSLLKNGKEDDGCLRIIEYSPKSAVKTASQQLPWW